VSELAGVDTPAAVVEVSHLERNLSRWQEFCDGIGLANRPHVKTHKSVEIARRQLELGAAGITCQKLGEAETMIDAGIDDVLIAYNILGESKLARLSALLERASVSVLADDVELLAAYARAAGGAGRELGVFADCDTGLGRTGVQTPEEAVDLAQAIAGHDGLRFDGFLTYPAPPDALGFLAAAVEQAAARGLSARVVSAGGTPAMWDAARLQPTVTEYRVGTYAFHDRATVAAGAAGLEDVALTVHATVVSRHDGRAILDAGSKALSSDLSSEPGYGLILEAPLSTIVKLNEEHAYVQLAPGEQLELGQVVRVVPNHACVVSNLFDEFVVADAGEIVATWPVDARGLSQ